MFFIESYVIYVQLHTLGVYLFFRPLKTRHFTLKNENVSPLRGITKTESYSTKLGNCLRSTTNCFGSFHDNLIMSTGLLPFYLNIK